MSYSFTKKTYSTQSTKTSSHSQAIEDAKKKTSLLKDNSWIRKDAEEDEPVERDPNFGKAVLSRYRTNETLDSSKSVDTKSPPQTTSGSTSVQSLTKRFSASQDELNKGSISSLKSTEEPRTTTVTKTIVKEEPKTSTTTTITKNGKTTEQTTTTTQNVVKTPTKTETFTEKVFSDNKSPSKSIAYTPPAPAKPKVSKTTENTIKTADDQLYDTLIPTSIKTKLTPDGATTVSKTETVTVKSSKDCSDGESTKTTTTTKTSATTEDKLFDTLLPTSFQSGYNSPDSTNTTTTTVTKKDIVVVDGTNGVECKSVTSPKSPTRTKSSYSSYSSIDDHPSSKTTSYTISSKPREEYTKTSSIKSYSSQPDSSYEYTSVTSPSAYTTTSYKDNSSRLDNLTSDSFTSKSIKSSYSTPERAVLEKDLCSYCRKGMSSDPKMVLEDMNINCHATCFKCEVCSSTLGHLKAGDSMWIYRRTVHCEKCFGVTREKWCR
ncbi:sciellin [Hypomesus transpacificus]|uniref:sciellin n=1 Tax=Hypomesus transpacificus TaxID=137520 RepID=UPI001F07B866|nr:sciellin [Hypomesus transpacificus]